MGPFDLPESTSLTLELESAGLLPEDLDEGMTEEEIRALVAYKTGNYEKATDELRYLPVDATESARRAWGRMAIARAASSAKPRDYLIFDQVVMGERTITEAAALAGIPITTARDRYHKVLTVVIKAIKNDPVVRAIFSDICAEVGTTIDDVLAAFAALGNRV
jgi:hypothetical protein